MSDRSEDNDPPTLTVRQEPKPAPNDEPDPLKPTKHMEPVPTPAQHNAARVKEQGHITPVGFDSAGQSPNDYTR